MLISLLHVHGIDSNTGGTLLMMIQHIELGSDLDDAAEELFTAVRK
jgi:hypothetical protein